MYIKRFVKHYYIMLIPALLWLFFFSIVPMFGIVMAFQDYNPGQGILHSKFVGLANFEYMFQMSDITQVLRNTVVIAVGKIIGNIIIPLVFALLLNELALKKLKRPIQTIVYLPYFLSWVILAKIVLNIFGYTGPVNQIIEFFGGEAVNFFGEAKIFQPLVIGTDIWKGFGYNTVVYLAAILGVDGSLYEAAAVDGCGRFKRIWHVTLPGIKTTVALLAILSLGNILNAGFDQIYNLYNPLVYSTGDIIDTWVYRAGLQNLQYSLATAVGLFKSVSMREKLHFGRLVSTCMGETAFFGSFLVSIKRVLLGTGMSMVCILMAAFPLSRTKKQFPKRDIFMWIFVFCMLFNGGTVPWYITMKNYHLMDNIFGLVLGTGLQVFNVILAVNFFKNLPVELEEACFVDGGGPWRNLISIYVPLAKPMVATVALFTMVMYWNEFFQGMVLSTRQTSYPLQTYIQQMVVTLDYSTMNVDQIAQAMKLNNLSLDSAKIFIAMIPVLIVYPFLQRYFVEGITLGSVKG